MTRALLVLAVLLAIALAAGCASPSLPSATPGPRSAPPSASATPSPTASPPPSATPESYTVLTLDDGSGGWEEIQILMPGWLVTVALDGTVDVRQVEDR